MGRVFDQHNITYLHVGGTVIGLVRDHGEYVPYDTDTDFGVDANDYEKLDKAIPDLQKTGYIFKWVYPEKEPKNTSKHWYMVGCPNKNCSLGPGIALYRTDSEHIEAPVPPWKYPKDIVVPPIRRVFEGMEMPFPRQPEKYLDFVYGKDKWRTPLKCDKHYYSQCNATLRAESLSILLYWNFLCFTTVQLYFRHWDIQIL
ncbi:hypothetical protein OS493_009637 [Desmophyllum pertusum]|uniref:LicD/FKTN/FKRP nucleotidyltransferase domain-containing protein n=1 Tax=Desmophyllum pertusum TaxID=174260 RepID=A0A9W9YR07_9CNID|nr:hypothetical protein OS493_009637 [Desmophyllum pertusum]